MPVPDKNVTPPCAPPTGVGDAHLIVPWAGIGQAAGTSALAGLELPHLRRLLATWHPAAPQRVDEYSLNPPHEQALARALGWATLPDGCLPWAAWHAGVTDRACAWFTPCHWNVGMEQVTLHPPEGLDLSETESRALMDALRPYCEEDGLALHFESAHRWRAEGPVLADLPWASLDRVAYRRLDPWLPDARRTPQARPLLRLQNEAQMLFYTHPVNDARGQRGASLVNGFWISGTGQLPAHTPSPPAPGGTGPLQWDDRLSAPALQGDWAAWAAAWQALDRELLQGWLALGSQQSLTLTLCGEHAFQSWRSTVPLETLPTKHWWQGWSRLWRKPPPAVSPADVLGGL
jgi:hypothetical protein